MIDLDKYHAEAKTVIDHICNLIIDRHDFKAENENSFSRDGTSKAILKNDLRIYFLWDFMEANIIWKFQDCKVEHGASIDYRDIYPENSFYHSMRNFREHCQNEKPSIYYDRFSPGAIKKHFLIYLEKWTAEYPDAFATGDFESIRHLVKHGHQSPESFKTEQALIEKMKQTDS